MSPARTSNRPPPLPPPPPPPRAFTLVETVVAMGVMAILLLGMAGAMSMSVTAVDMGKDRGSRAVLAAAAADVILADLNESTAIYARTRSDIDLTVSDRDQDGSPDTVNYRWDAVGSPVYRSVDGQDPQVLVAGVDRFTIDLLRRAGAASSTSAEQVLASYDISPGATTRTFSLSNKDRAAQYLKPPFADDVDSWKITRVRIRLARDSTPTSTLRVSIVNSNAWKPTGAVLATLDIPEASLPGLAGWVDLPIGAGPLAPGQGVFIVLREISGIGASGSVEYGSGGASMPYNTYFTTSSDYAATWSAPDDAIDMRFIAYGTITGH